MKSKILLIPFMLFTGACFADVSDYIKNNKLTDTGYGDIKLNESIDSASKTSNVEISKYIDNYEEECGSYVFGEGGALNIGQLRILTTSKIIKRIDVWDENIPNMFGLNISDEYKGIDESLYTKEQVEPNHMSGKSHYFYLKNGNVLRVSVVNNLIEWFAIGMQPEIESVEGCA